MDVAAGAGDVEALVEALVEEAIVDVLEPALGVGTAGSASKVTWAVNAGLPPSQPAPPLALGPAESDWVELCSDTSLTPSIRRRRWSISATSA